MARQKKKKRSARTLTVPSEEPETICCVAATMSAVYMPEFTYDVWPRLATGAGGGAHAKAAESHRVRRCGCWASFWDSAAAISTRATAVSVVAGAGEAGLTTP